MNQRITKRKKTKNANLKLKDLNTKRNPRGGRTRLSGLWANHNEILLADFS